jgi:GNAT superfamily N-acetyltransferase
VGSKAVYSLMRAPELVPASRFSLAELARGFTGSFEGYVIPLTIDEPGFRRMAELFDFNLDISRVAVRDGKPVGLVNVGLRGASAWIGGMGVVPSERRAGIGEALMQSAHEAAAACGVAEVWLEVITSNTPALRLYEKLGYEQIRDLEVWEIEAAPRPSTAREADVHRAHEQVRALRRTREPWQRSDATLEHILASEAATGLVVDRSAAAVVRSAADHVTVEQIAARDVDAAAEILSGALAGKRRLRLSNIPAGDDAALALARLGSEPRLRQHELRLRLN